MTTGPSARIARATALILAACLVLVTAAWAAEKGGDAPAAPAPAPAAPGADVAVDVPATTIPRDLSKLSPEELDRLEKALEGEINQIEQRLAEVPGKQYEEKRVVLYRRKDAAAEAIKRVGAERRRRDIQAYDQQIQAIKDKYAAQIDAIEARKAEDRAQTIQRFEQTLEGSALSDLAPDILFRLGVLYLDKENDDYLVLMRKYEEEVDRLVQQGAPVTPVEPTKTYPQAERIFRDIAERFPKFHAIDGVLYNLAFILGETGAFEEANRTFAKLIADAPASPFVPEAYVRMGEYDFDMDRFEDAIERYQHVLKYTESTFYDKALYKLGWSYFKMNRFDEARDYFSRVVDFSERKRRTTLRADDLRTESITYIAVSFADEQAYEFGGGDRAALAYFQQHGDHPWKGEVLAAIGDVYFERASYTGARDAYNTLLGQNPYSPRAPELIKKIIESYERTQDYERAIAEGERLAALFGAGSPWRQANQGDAAAMANADNLIQAALYASSTFHHEQAQQAPAGDAQRREYAGAIASYRDYLTQYPTSENAYKARFNLAESLYFSNRFADAASEYLALVELGKGKYYEDAAFSLIKSWDNLLKAEGGLKNKPAAGSKLQLLPEMPIGQAAQGLANATQLYVKLFPGDKKRNPDFLFKAGEVYYYHGHYDKARKIFERLTAEYPNAPAAKLAANLTIESYKAQERFAELETYSKKISKVGTIVTTAEEKKQIDVIIQDAAFVSAQKAQAQGEYAGAVSEYLRAATEHPNLENAPKALHNAAVIYETNLRNIYKANELYAEAARKYPKWDGAATDLFHAAYNYEKIVEIEKAMGLYEEFGILFPAAKEAPDALFNAGLLREKNREYSKAIAIYQRHLRQYPVSNDAGSITFAVARLYEEMKQPAQQAEWLGRYVRGFSNDGAKLTEAYCKLGKLAEAARQPADAAANYARAVAVFRRTPGSAGIDVEAKWAGEAWFRMLDPDFQAYKAVRFSLPQSKMAKQLEQKAAMWKRLREEYQKVISLGNFDWASAALYRIGMIDKEFADSLFHAPVPEGLTPEEEDAYVVSLEDKAFPVESRAIEAFTTNVQKAAQFRYRNEWIDLSYDELRKYKPEDKETRFEIPSPGVSDVLYDYPELTMLED
jgi:TolA-binding protein